MDVTKTRKKQQELADSIGVSDSYLDEAILTLEEVCARLLETRFAIRDDSERMYWQQRLKNVVTPVSLALAEVRGPRRFHNHYRHDSNDKTVLLPVLENPLEMLAHTCKHALEESSKKLSGIHDDDLILVRRRLERALNNFLNTLGG